MEPNIKKSVIWEVGRWFILMMLVLVGFAIAEKSEAQVITRADIFKSGNLSKTWYPPFVSLGTLATLSGTETFTNKTLVSGTMSFYSISNVSGTGVSFTHANLNDARIVSASVTTFSGNDFHLTSGTIRSFSASLGLLNNYSGSSFTLTTGSVSNATITNSVWVGGIVSSPVINNPTISGGSISGTVFYNPVATLTGSTTLTVSYTNVLVNAVTSTFTVTLPSASATDIIGKSFTLTKNSLVNSVIIATSNTQAICGQLSIRLIALRDSVNIYSNGVGWEVVGGCNRTTYVRYGGAANDQTTCTSTPCTIHRQSGEISSVARAILGNYDISFFTGTFSDEPTCTGVAYNNAAGTMLTPTNGSQTSFNFASVNFSGTNVDSWGNVICVGPR